MHAERAAALLNGMSYKPGYFVLAEPMGSDLVAMELVMSTYDSTPELGGRMNPSQIVSPVAYFDSGPLDEEGVMGAGLKIIIEVETHEAREFWRRGRGGPAPFHPHNRDGEAAMQRISSIPVQIKYPAPR